MEPQWTIGSTLDFDSFLDGDACFQGHRFAYTAGLSLKEYWENEMVNGAPMELHNTER